MLNVNYENLNVHMFKYINQLIETGDLDGKFIVLFGLNSSSYNMKDYLEEKGFKVHAYIDNDENKCDLANEALDFYLPRHIMKNKETHNYNDYLVYAYKPERLLFEFRDDTVVLIASKYYEQMCSQLEAMGYIENKHFYQVIDFYGLDKLIDFSDTKGMEELNLEQVKQIEIGILKHIKAICEKHKLRYYLCGGTLLGAIRHKGFIPWDDDVDIALPMKDYKQLIELLENNERYIPLTPYKNADIYHSFFMKVMDKTTIMKSWDYPFFTSLGVNIDIFPLYGLPEKDVEIECFYNKLRKLNVEYVSADMKDIESSEKSKSFRKEILKMMEMYEFDKSQKIGYLLSKYKEKEIMPKLIYDKSVKVEFEGELFDAAVGYEDYLKRIFGDYMALPPENERVTPHNFRAFKNN